MRIIIENKLKERVHSMVNRTAEKVLSIISAVFTTIGIIMSFAIMAFYNFMKSDPTIREDFEAEMLSDPALNPQDLELFYSILILGVGEPRLPKAARNFNPMADDGREDRDRRGRGARPSGDARPGMYSHARRFR